MRPKPGRLGVGSRRASSNTTGRTPAPSRRLSRKRLLSFTQTLAVLLEAHLPLVQALDLAAGHGGDARVQAWVTDLRRRVERGEGFAEALRAHPGSVPGLYAHLVEVGEQTGRLDAVLARLGTHLEAGLALRRTIQQALVYPALVLVLALGVTAFMLTVIVPTFAGLFEEFGAELPQATQWVMALSDQASTLALAALAAVVLGAGLVRLGRRHPSWMARAERIAVRVPVVGTLRRLTLTSYFCRTAATMLSHGVSLSDTLESLARADVSPRLREVAAGIARDTGRGIGVAEALARTDFFPPLAIQFAAAGEASGTLGPTLERAATLFDAEVKARLEVLTAALEPLLILIVGALLGALILALYLPIFELNTIVG